MMTIKNKRVVGVIPARWASTRLPGKPLAMISGKPMIQRVMERVVQAKTLSTGIVATDDQRIVDAVNSFGIPEAKVVMTRADHPSGTDRIAEAVADEELAKAKSMASGTEELTAIEAEIKMLKTNPKVEV